MLLLLITEIIIEIKKKDALKEHLGI